MESVTYRKQLNGLTRVDMEEYFDDVELENLYQWLDRIPLSRPKKDIAKDFADGVLVAEIVKHYFPRMVELHNYAPASNMNQKISNWWTLNRKVMKKLCLDLTEEVIRALCLSKPRVIEKVLMLIRVQIDLFLKKQGRSRNEVDYNFLQQSQQSDDFPLAVKQPGQIKDSTNKSQALVPVKGGRSSPGKLASPRRLAKGEIPHNHPDRSTYNFEKRTNLYDPLYLLPTNDRVPRSFLEEKEVECLAKDDTIKMLNSKIRRLEHLMRLKDDRMLDLQGQLAREQGLYHVITKRHVIP